MKILYLNTLYAPYKGGGVEKTLQTLAECICSRGHEVTVLTTSPEHNNVENTVNDVRIVRTKLANVYWPHKKIRPPSWKRLMWHLFDIYNPVMGTVVSKIIQDLRPDVVSNYSLAGFSAAAWSAIRRSRTPMVQVLNDQYNLCPNSNMFKNNKSCDQQCLRCRCFRLFHPKLSETVQAVVGTSRFVLERHLQNNLFQRAKIKKVIHDVRLMSPTPKKSLISENNQIQLGFIGTLSPAKGIEMLLNVFMDLDLPNTTLLVAGKGKMRYEESLKARFKSSKIRFLGYSNPKRFFPMIDMLVVPSICNDTFPGVIIEALAFGVPVVGSSRGGIPEMIKQGKNGYLFDPEHPEDLAAIITKISKCPLTIESLIPNAVASSQSFLDVDNWITQWESLYRDIVKLNRIFQL